MNQPDHGTATAVAAATQAPATAQPRPLRKAYLPQANEVLAMVNGHAITLRDLAPFNGTNATATQPIDTATYDYLLQRAINRQLITQAAQDRGVGLSDGQTAQLDKIQALREQGEPGLVAKISVNPEQIAFDLQDQRVFMLQTSLMAAQGMSPDVTESQVQQYYQAHTADYGALPTDPQAQQQAWSEIDKQIRFTLAQGARAQYQQQLDQYMGQLRSSANIVLTPMTEAAVTGQGIGS